MNLQGDNKHHYEDISKLLELAGEVARIGIWSQNVNDNEICISGEFWKILGIEHEFITGHGRLTDFLPEGEYRDKFAKAISDVLDNGKPFDFESMMVLAKGEQIWVRTIGRSEQINGRTFRLFGTVQDITELKLAEIERTKKENMLRAISTSTEYLLSDTDVFSAIASCLAVIGVAANVDRVYLFQNSLTPESKLVASQKYEWNSGIAEPQIDNPELQNVPIEIFDKYLPDLYNRQCFNVIVGELPDDLEMKVILQVQDIKSILIFPIFCDNQFWGYVGFDECKYNRKWKDDDISVLRSFCNSIASAIERTDATRELYNLSLFPLENPDPVFRLDLQGRVSYKNKVAESITHLTYQDKGYSFDEFSSLIASEICKDAPMQQFEIDCENKIFLITSVLSQSQVYINNYGNDITALKTALNALEIARRNAEDSSDLKELFIANMSHEIRTPLNAIIGMLREVTRESLSPNQQLYLKNAGMASKHLLSIINDILDLAKIKSQQIGLDIVNFNLQEAIDEAVSILTPVAQEKMLNIASIKNPQLAPSYIGDASRISQILVNILSNAVKYTEKGGITVECEITASANHRDHIIIRISDTGKGMDEQFIENILQKFAQRDFSTIRKHGGIGLGMALTYELVELMKGKIGILSKPGVGTTISIELDLEAGSEDDIIKGISPQRLKKLKDKKILLVEDNNLNRIVARNCLQFYGMKIIEAFNGLEAIERLKSSKVDLILMDLRMPEMGGLEATEIIRNEMGLQTPIIALTANAYKTEIDRCLKAGMNDYVLKPFDEDTLIEAILRNIAHIEHSENNLRVADFVQSDIKLFDLSLIVSMSRGNTDFINKMIAVFIDETPAAVEEIKKSWQNKDFQTIRKVAHRIKPNLANFGIHDLRQDIQTIELLAEEELVTADFDKRIQNLDMVIKTVVAQLANEKY